MRNTRAPPPPVALLARLLPRLLIAAALVVSILYLSSASERWRQKTNSAAIGRRQLHLALAVGGRAAKPPHIPRTVHQMLIFGNWTAAGGGQNRAILPAQLGAQAQAAMQTWDDVNPGWEHRLWGGADIEALLRERYPQYLPTWAALSRPVERADMARSARPARPPALRSARSVAHIPAAVGRRQHCFSVGTTSAAESAMMAAGFFVALLPAASRSVKGPAARRLPAHAGTWCCISTAGCMLTATCCACGQWML